MKIKEVKHLFWALLLAMSPLLIWASDDLEENLSIHDQFILENKEKIQDLFEREDEIIGLELIIADGASDVLMSRFGHTMLRFVTRDENPFDDFVLSFVADIDSNQLSSQLTVLRKGVVGGFPVLPMVDNTVSFWRTYAINESRPLTRYIIPTTAENRHRLLENLRSLFDSKNKNDYTFFSNNCAGVLAKLFKQSGFPQISSPLSSRIPVLLPRHMTYSLLSLYPSIRVDSIQVLTNRLVRQWKIRLRDFLAGSFPSDIHEKLKSLTELELKQLDLLFAGKQGSEVISAFLREKKVNYYSGASLVEVINFKKLPSEFYTLCTEKPCAKRILTLEQQNFSSESVKDSRQQRDFIYWLLVNRGNPSNENTMTPTFHEDIKIFPNSLRKTPEYLIHLQQLLQAENF